MMEDGWVDGWMDRWRMDGWMGGWKGRRYECMDEQTNGKMDEQVY